MAYRFIHPMLRHIILVKPKHFKKYGIAIRSTKGSKPTKPIEPLYQYLIPEKIKFIDDSGERFIIIKDISKDSIPNIDKK
jgi:hypothetical protein